MKLFEGFGYLGKKEKKNPSFGPSLIVTLKVLFIVNCQHPFSITYYKARSGSSPFQNEMECSFKGWDSFQRYLRASTLVDVKSWKIQKVLHFTHFDQRNTYIIECKIVHKCISATVIVHICTVIVALAFNILAIFLSPCLWFVSLSLFLIWSNHQTSKTINPLATLDLWLKIQIV